MKIASVCVPFKVVTLPERKRQIEKLLAEAGKKKVKLLAFPEFCFTQRTKETIQSQDSEEGFYKYSESIPGGANFTLMADAARQHRMTIVYGTFERKDSRHMYNTAVAIGPNGKIIGKHRKAILASAEGEDYGGATLQGENLDLIHTPLGKAGVITCYEMYFPEVARVYELNGADFLVYIHADNAKTTREVARARSRDGFLPVVCGCYASSAGTYVLDARGNTVAETRREGLAVADIDLTAQPYDKYRWNGKEKVNLRKTRWYQRRPELFGALVKKMNVPHPLKGK